MTHNIKAVLFDMDGTVTDTEKIYNKMWQKSAHDLGVSEFSNEDALYLRSLNRIDAAAYIKKRFPNGAAFMEIHDLCMQYVKEEMAEKGIELKPNIKEFLTILKERHIRSAIVTATELPRAIPQMKKAGLYDFFDEIISAHEVKQGKPHPDPYIYACKKLGEAPHECIAVEDSPNGAISAIDAGCLTIMVPDLTEPDEELRARLFAVCPTVLEITQYL